MVQDNASLERIRPILWRISAAVPLNEQIQAGEFPLSPETQEAFYRSVRGAGYQLRENMDQLAWILWTERHAYTLTDIGGLDCPCPSWFLASIATTLGLSVDNPLATTCFNMPLSQMVPGSRSRDLCHCMNSWIFGISKGGGKAFIGRYLL